MKRLLLAVIILISMIGGAAYSVQQGLYVPGNFTVTGTTGATGKIYAPSGINAVGGTVEADYFTGNGSALSNLSINYAILSGTASQAADLIITGQATGSALVYNGSNWSVLVPGAAGQTLISKGPGVMPSFEGVAWFRTVATSETILSPLIAIDSLALMSDSKFYFNSSQTQYLRWNSGQSRFEFSDKVYADGVSGGFVGSGTNLTSLDASQLTQGIVGTARGGLGNDISGASWGSILYHDSSTWRVLAPGTSGYVLKTQGGSADPIWGIGGGTVTFVNTTGSLTGGPITGIGTLDVADGGITAAKLQTGSVTSGAIADGSIAAVDFGSGAVTSGAIALNTISAANLANGAVTSGAIALGTITAANMGADSVTTDALATDNSPTYGNFLRWNGSSMDWATAGSITGSLEVDHVTINHNINGSLEVLPGGIDASRLATGSVTSAAIADGSIAAVDLGSGVVTSGAIALNTITAANLANGAVTSGAIALGTITAANMGTNSVTQAAIAAGSPGTNYFLRWNGSSMDWASPAALTGSLEVDNITIDRTVNASLEVRVGGIDASRLATGSVTSAAIADNTITGADINTTTVITAAAFSGTILGTVSSANYAAFSGTATNAGYATLAQNASSAAYAVITGTASKAADLNITGQATGEILYFNGTNWVTLESGAAGSTLRSGGPGANPTWLQGGIKRIGTTIETYYSGDDLALNGGAKLILDNSFLRYLTWDQGSTKFLFNGTVSAESFTGSGSGLTGMSASNISGGVLGRANGGLNSDTSGALQGSILYLNSSGKWVALGPDTSGKCLMTMGSSADPMWSNMGSVTSVGVGRGLTTAVNPITTTGVITIDTNVVVTTSDAQTLTNKTINSSTVDGTSTINITGIATFAASGIGLNVTNIGHIGGQLVIGADTTFDATNPETLKVDAGTSTSKNVISGIGNLNNYLQLNIHNRHNGTAASSDLVATADDGDETNYYLDIGINSSGFNNPSYAGGPHTVYLMGLGADMYVENAQPGKSLIFMTGGAAPGDERMVIDGSGKISIGTLTPEASSILTVAGNENVTGSLTAETIKATYLYGNGTGITNVTASGVANGSISAAMFGSGVVTSGAIADLTIVGTDLAAGINISTTGYVTGDSFRGGLIVPTAKSITMEGAATFTSGSGYMDIRSSVTTFEGETYVKAGKTISLGDTTSGSSNLLVPFLFSGTVNAGDVVVLDTSGSNTVKETTTAKDPNVVGFAERVEGTTAYVAVSGRITTAVANQAINVGDAICTSATAGRVNGYNALQTGKMIGMAVTSAAGSGNTLSVLIYKY